MSAQMSIIGRLTKDARLVQSTNNDQKELLYFNIATDLYGYTDKNKNNEYQQITEFYDVQLSFKKGGADRWLKNNMLAKGHMLEVRNLILLQRDPKESNGKYFQNNLFILLPNMSIYDNVEFLQYPHAVSANGQSSPQH
jgi:hypothetical protein